MQCTKCKIDLGGGTYCAKCGTDYYAESANLPVDAELQQHFWVKKNTEILKKIPFLPKKPFLPDENFYAQYNSKSFTEGLHYMANVLFKWLNIEPKGAIIDFYDKKDIPAHKKDVAGFYTTIYSGNERKEIIFINLEYKENPLAVGAILTHELMHLYLSRLNLKIDDIQENELLTDLATIQAGLGILVLNGMKYSNNWLLSLILLFVGYIYWHREERVFGYYKPKVYAHYLVEYFKERNINLKEIVGHINPYARHFLAHDPSYFILHFTPKTKSTKYIKSIEKSKNITTLIQLIVAGIILFYFVGSNFIPGSTTASEKDKLKSQIDSCEIEIATMEYQIKNDSDRLNEYDKQLNSYEANGQIDKYNNLVSTRNILLKKIKGEESSYNSKIDNCNNLLKIYNNS